jgi:hypothetical protein
LAKGLFHQSSETEKVSSTIMVGVVVPVHNGRPRRNCKLAIIASLITSPYRKRPNSYHGRKYKLFGIFYEIPDVKQPSSQNNRSRTRRKYKHFQARSAEKFITPNLSTLFFSHRSSWIWRKGWRQNLHQWNSLRSEIVYPVPPRCSKKCQRLVHKSNNYNTKQLYPPPLQALSQSSLVWNAFLHYLSKTRSVQTVQ